MLDLLHKAMPSSECIEEPLWRIGSKIYSHFCKAFSDPGLNLEKRAYWGTRNEVLVTQDFIIRVTTCPSKGTQVRYLGPVIPGNE